MMTESENKFRKTGTADLLGKNCSSSVCKARRMGQEFTMPFFDSWEPHCHKTLDNEKNFCILLPRSEASAAVGWNFNPLTIILAKIFLWCLIIASLMSSWIQAETHSFFMAYWSHWIFTYSAVYHSLSVLTSISSLGNPSLSRTDGAPPPPSCLVKATWLFFSISGVHQITLVMIF